MKDITDLNEALTRLDGQYRHGRIDRIQFRKMRRELLLGGSVPEPPTRVPGTVFDADNSLPVDVTLDRSALSEAAPREAAARNSEEQKKSLSTAKLLIALVVLMATGAGIYLATNMDFGSNDSKSERNTAASTAALQAELVIANLLSSDWTDEDLNRFLESWSGLPEASVSAAKGKQRIWTLRSQVEQRLRDANDAASIDPSEDATRRVNLLELVSIRIGA